MKGLKKNELEVGKIYKCLLSGLDILVLETESQSVKVSDIETKEIPAKKIGKIFYKLATGECKFAYIDVEDGSLTDKNNRLWNYLKK